MQEEPKMRSDLPGATAPSPRKRRDKAEPEPSAAAQPNTLDPDSPQPSARGRGGHKKPLEEPKPASDPSLPAVPAQVILTSIPKEAGM